MFRNLFGLRKPQPQHGPPPKAPSLNRKPLIGRLDPSVRFFANAFYSHFDDMFPNEFCFGYDDKAPENVGEKSNRLADETYTSMSLSFNFNRELKDFKYGTGRVEVRGKNFFAKTVTWKTPKEFLYQPAVRHLIKKYYPDCHLAKNHSKSQNGFTIKNGYQVITLEVFGQSARSGFLACDITLNKKNQPLARDRAFHFLDFYGELYNQVGDQNLHFDVHRQGSADLNLQFIDDGIQHIDPQGL